MTPEWTVLEDIAVHCEQLVPYTSIRTEMVFMIHSVDSVIVRPGAYYDLPKNWIIA